MQLILEEGCQNLVQYSYTISYIYAEPYSTQMEASNVTSEIHEFPENSLGSAYQWRPGQATSVI